MMHAERTASRWLSPAPTHCDLCHGAIGKTFYDVAVRVGGPWGCVCPSCFHFNTVGRTGVGYGQRYDRNREGVYVCTEGGMR